MGNTNDNQNNNERIWEFNPSLDSQDNFDSSFKYYGLFSREESVNDINTNASPGVILEIKNSSKESLINDNIQEYSRINPNTTQTINNLSEAIVNEDIKTEESKKENFFYVFRQNKLRGRKRKKTQDKNRTHNKSQLPDVTSLAAHKLYDAFLHLGGGLVGEGEGEDAERVGALADEVGDAVGQCACLARTSAGYYHHGAFDACRCLALRFVQLV